MHPDPPAVQAPPPVAALSHLPPNLLPDLAKSLNTSEENLSTLVVSNDANPLYQAIIEYSALSATPSPLRISSFEPQSPTTSDSEDLDGFFGASNGLRRNTFALLPKSISRIDRPSRSKSHKRVRVPRFTLASGKTVITWPPPPHLAAQFLAEQRVHIRRQARKKRRLEASKARKAQAAADHANATNHTDSLLTHVPSPSVSLSNWEQDTDKPVEKPAEPTGDPDTDKPRHDIQVVHYTIGDPISSPINEVGMLREVLLVSPDGMEVLRNFAKEILHWRYARDHGGKDDANKFFLQRLKSDTCRGTYWHEEGLKRARPSASVILPDGQMQSILDDVRSFLRPETRKWYLQHGLPQRRSYLFYGVPGSGKTSTIRVIASLFRLTCCYLSMTTANFNNQMLGDALSSLPPRALIVLEDVDALFTEDRKNAAGTALTFSGLLNALDGLISAQGVITIMTTNHFERLDKALVRGGRVDRRFHFGKPTNQQIIDLFRSFYPDADNAIAEKFLRKIFERTEGEEARAISTLQQLFIKQRDSTPEECVTAIDTFYKEHFPEGTTGRDGNLYI